MRKLWHQAAFLPLLCNFLLVKSHMWQRYVVLIYTFFSFFVTWFLEHTSLIIVKLTVHKTSFLSLRRHLPQRALETQFIVLLSASLFFSFLIYISVIVYPVPVLSERTRQALQSTLSSCEADGYLKEAVVGRRALMFTLLHCIFKSKRHQVSVNNKPGWNPFLSFCLNTVPWIRPPPPTLPP